MRQISSGLLQAMAAKAQAKAAQPVATDVPRLMNDLVMDEEQCNAFLAFVCRESRGVSRVCGTRATLASERFAILAVVSFFCSISKCINLRRRPQRRFQGGADSLAQRGYTARRSERGRRRSVGDRAGSAGPERRRPRDQRETFFGFKIEGEPGGGCVERERIPREKTHRCADRRWRWRNRRTRRG